MHISTRRQFGPDESKSADLRNVSRMNEMITQSCVNLNASVNTWGVFYTPGLSFKDEHVFRTHFSAESIIVERVLKLKFPVVIILVYYNDMCNNEYHYIIDVSSYVLRALFYIANFYASTGELMKLVTRYTHR